MSPSKASLAASSSVTCIILGKSRCGLTISEPWLAPTRSTTLRAFSEATSSFLGKVNSTLVTFLVWFLVFSFNCDEVHMYVKTHLRNTWRVSS